MVEAAALTGEEFLELEEECHAEGAAEDPEDADGVDGEGGVAAVEEEGSTEQDDEEGED